MKVPSISVKKTLLQNLSFFRATTCNQSRVFTFVNIQADHVTLRVHHTNYQTMSNSFDCLHKPLAKLNVQEIKSFEKYMISISHKNTIIVDK